MGQGKPQYSVAAPTFLQTFASSSTLMKDLMKEAKLVAKPPTGQAGGGGGGGGSALATTLSSAPETQRQSLLVEFISGEVAKILALDGASDVDPTQPLTEMGLDSLMAVELRNALADAVDAALPATLLFDYPMVVAIAEYLIKDVLTLDEVEEVEEASASAPAGAPAAPASAKAETVIGDASLAVVGMSSRFPAGGNTTELFWENLCAGKNCIELIPTHRWDWKEYYSSDMDAPGKTYSKWAGIIDEEADMFDAFFFGIVPKEACGMDPQQRKLMEVAWETMERSGHHLEPSRGSPIGVYVGICSNDYQMLQTATGDKSFCDAYYGTGNANSVAGGRIAYVMGFQGPTVSVDTACSSSVIALHLASQAIQLGECEMARCQHVDLTGLIDQFFKGAYAFQKWPLLHVRFASQWLRAR
jgi:acyl carrier protein